MLIRAFQTGDAAALRQIFYSAVREIANKHYSAEQLAAWAPEQYDPESWAQRMRQLQPQIAVDGGTIVGYADVQLNGYIDHFFVSPWAARRGVGALLMRRLHQIAQRNAAERLFADVSITAFSFFMREGFRVERIQNVRINQATLQNFRMSKILRAENGIPD